MAFNFPHVPLFAHFSTLFRKGSWRWQISHYHGLYSQKTQSIIVYAPNMKATESHARGLRWDGLGTSTPQATIYETFMAEDDIIPRSCAGFTYSNPVFPQIQHQELHDRKQCMWVVSDFAKGLGIWRELIAVWLDPLFWKSLLNKKHGVVFRGYQRLILLFIIVIITLCILCILIGAATAVAIGGTIKCLMSDFEERKYSCLAYDGVGDDKCKGFQLETCWWLHIIFDAGHQSRC